MITVGLLLVIVALLCFVAAFVCSLPRVGGPAMVFLSLGLAFWVGARLLGAG